MLKKLFISSFLVTLITACGSGGGSDSSTQTTLKVKNSSTSQVEVWLTLGNVDGFVTDVNEIFGITASGLQGSFNLGAGEELEYTSEKGKKT